MSNIFLKKDTHNIFQWDTLGDISAGRENLGENMPVIVYRLLEYTMLDVLVKRYGEETADEIFRESGYMAGEAFARNALDLTLSYNEFIATLQKTLKDLKIGILRIEEFDMEQGKFTLTIGEDLDCSGLPVTGEYVCNYDEGFLAGILFAYTGKKYTVKEVDCWASGDRVCRFKGCRNNG